MCIKTPLCLFVNVLCLMHWKKNRLASFGDAQLSLSTISKTLPNQLTLDLHLAPKSTGVLNRIKILSRETMNLRPIWS
jgi:hypothetical protein